MATSPDTSEARCVAACRADPHVVVGGVAAANLWEFDRGWEVDDQRFERLTEWVLDRHTTRPWGVGGGARQSVAWAGRGSLGRPRTRSPTMLRWIWLVPPQIVSEREKKNADIIGLTGYPSRRLSRAAVAGHGTGLR